MAKISDIMVLLSGLLGEDSVPTSGIDGRITFAREVCKDVISRKRWSWNDITVPVTFTNKRTTLPVDYREGGVIELKDANEVDYDFYIVDNEIVLYKEKDTLNLTYEKKAPAFTDINDQTDFAVPLPMVVARGALIDVRRSENPFADVAPETTEYENDIKKLFKLERQAEAHKRKSRQLRSKASYYGTAI